MSKKRSYTEIRIPFSSAAFCDAAANPQKSNRPKPVTPKKNTPTTSRPTSRDNFTSSPRKGVSAEKVTSRPTSRDTSSPRQGRSQEKVFDKPESVPKEALKSYIHGGTFRKEKLCQPVCPPGCVPEAEQDSYEKDQRRSSGLTDSSDKVSVAKTNNKRSISSPPTATKRSISPSPAAKRSISPSPAAKRSISPSPVSGSSGPEDRASLSKTPPPGAAFSKSRPSNPDQKPPFIPAGRNKSGRYPGSLPNSRDYDPKARFSINSYSSAGTSNNTKREDYEEAPRSCTCPSTERKEEMPTYSKSKRGSAGSTDKTRPRSAESVNSGSGSKEKMSSSRKNSKQSEPKSKKRAGSKTRLDEEDFESPENVTSGSEIEGPSSSRGQRKTSRDSSYSERRNSEGKDEARKKINNKTAAYDGEADDETDENEENQLRRSNRTGGNKDMSEEDEVDEVNGPMSQKKVKKFLLSNPVFLNSFVEEHIDATTLHDWVQQKCCGNTDQAKAYRDAKSRRKAEKREARARRASQTNEDEDENDDSEDNASGAQNLQTLNFKLDQIPGCPSQGVPREMTDDEIRRFRTLYGIDLRGGASNRGCSASPQVQVCRAKFEMPSPSCGQASPKPVGVKCPAFRQYQQTHRHFGGPGCQCPRCRKKRC